MKTTQKQLNEKILNFLNEMRDDPDMKTWCERQVIDLLLIHREVLEKDEEKEPFTLAYDGPKYMYGVSIRDKKEDWKELDVYHYYSDDYNAAGRIALDACGRSHVMTGRDDETSPTITVMQTSLRNGSHSKLIDKVSIRHYRKQL